MTWIGKQRRRLQRGWRNEYEFRRTMAAWPGGSQRAADVLHPFHPSADRLRELFERHPFDIPQRFGALFVGIPKTACTAVCRGLFGDLRLVPHHPGIRGMRAVFGEAEFTQLFKFAFVRNPYERLLSAFTYLRSDKCGRFDRRYARRLRRHDFQSFVHDYLTEDTLYDWMHLVPQWEFIAEPDGTLITDFVGRHENIAADYETVRERLKIGEDLPRVNVVGRGHMTAEYYDEATAARVHELYRRDFELFEYSSGSWSESFGPNPTSLPTGGERGPC